MISVEKAANLAFFTGHQHSLFADFHAVAMKNLRPSRLLFVSAGDRSGKSQAKAPRKAAGKSATVTVHPKSFADLALLDVPISFARVEQKVEEWLVAIGPAVGTIIAVDMGWGLETNSAAANFDRWMVLADRCSARPGVSMVSLYNRRLLIDEQLHAALRGHPAILTTHGVVANPHALPPELLTHGTMRQHVDHWLGALSPDLASPSVAAEHAAEGADPMWLLRRSAEDRQSAYSDASGRWKIRCFGRLRIYRNDGSQVNWEIAGGATRKTKTLFAYLLQKGGRGASAEELADFLWPDADSAEVARNRLYHTVKCLRDALAPAPMQAGERSEQLLRDGSRYVLVPPEKSWLDISTFEQLCRQSQGHIKSGANDEALICLQAADRLYTGDLFEDIPAEYADDSERDWCWSKRYWLRDMFFKVQRDAARIYRARRDFSAALSHCQKALAIDPLCEMAHEEAMHVFRAQGRREAIDRQYKLYRDSLTHFDERPQSAALGEIYRSLSRSE